MSGPPPFSCPAIDAYVLLWNAAESNDVKAITELMTERRLDIHHGDENALFVAVRNSHLEAVGLLLDYKADPGCKHIVSIAVSCSRVEVLHLLLAHGPVPEEAGRLLRIARMQKHLDKIDCLAARIFRIDGWKNKTPADVDERRHLLCQQMNGSTVGPEETQAAEILTNHAQGLSHFLRGRQMPMPKLGAHAAAAAHL